MNCTDEGCLTAAMMFGAPGIGVLDAAPKSQASGLAALPPVVAVPAPHDHASFHEPTPQCLLTDVELEGDLPQQPVGLVEPDCLVDVRRLKSDRVTYGSVLTV